MGSHSNSKKTPMNTLAAPTTEMPAAPAAAHRPKLDAKPGPITLITFVGLLAAGLLFTAWSLVGDVTASGAPMTTWVPYLWRGVARLIALGFEFVNGFHD